MIKARPKYPTDLYDNIYIDNIQKVVVICLIIPTAFSPCFFFLLLIGLIDQFSITFSPIEYGL